MEPAGDILKGLRILVAEDEFLILMDIENMLCELGCEIVGPVATVDAALDAIGRQPMDGALLDINLNGKRITPAAEELAVRGIPFVLCSGYGSEPRDEAVIRDALRLTKPFNLDSLRAMMEKAFSEGARR